MTSIDDPLGAGRRAAGLRPLPQPGKALRRRLRSRRRLGRRAATLLGLAAALWAAAPCRAGELRTLEPGPAPALELPDLAGVTYRLADWHGQVVLVNFWATWCPPCLEEMPSLQRLAERLRGQPFAVVAVNVAEAERRVAHRTKQMGLDLPVLLDADGAAFKAWGGKGLPTSVLVDRSGAVRYLGLGPLEWDGAEAVTAIEGLLSEGR
jgi:thiol-disulfide isomerase/thioredoxin